VKKIIVAKSKEVKTGLNLTEYSKGSYGSKRALLPMMITLPCTGTIRKKKNP
jgi:hypothetical protein